MAERLSYERRNVSVLVFLIACNRICHPGGLDAPTKIMAAEPTDLEPLITPRDLWIQIRRLILSAVAVLDKYYRVEKKV